MLFLLLWLTAISTYDLKHRYIYMYHLIPGLLCLMLYPIQDTWFISIPILCTGLICRTYIGIADTLVLAYLACIIDSFQYFLLICGFVGLVMHAFVHSRVIPYLPVITISLVIHKLIYKVIHRFLYMI